MTVQEHATAPETRARPHPTLPGRVLAPLRAAAARPENTGRRWFLVASWVRELRWRSQPDPRAIHRPPATR